MIFHHLGAFFIFLMPWAFLGCISVNLSQESLKSAEKVHYTPPPPPFEQIHSPEADKTWRNSQSGNTITYVSECGNVDKVSLKDVAKTLMKSQGLIVLSQSETTLHQTPAVFSKGEHRDQKNPVLLHLYTFRMKECLFNLAYLGSKKKFPEDMKQFEVFAEKFEGP